jgi:2-polyprenyl-6-methoxyphenol hydroxylase-like FAD-dependent oxidoreductase
MTEAKIAIIGGGISGLSTAIALQKKGIKVSVYEKDTVFNGPDSGIVLSGNAIRSFYIMGLGPSLLANGLAADQCCLKSDSGKVIATFDYHAPSHIPNYLFIQRSELHKILTDALEPDSLYPGKKLEDFKQDGKKITLHFSDGTETETDYLIGCDGGDSPIRTKLKPDSKLTFSGYACWRGFIENPAIFNIPYTETWGPRGRFGIAPLPDNQLYWYAFKKLEHSKVDMPNWTPIDLLFNFFYYHDPIQQILESTKQENILYDELYVLKPLEQFHFENILLMGDSAHASLPNIGQGASQAIEDAVYVSKWITSEKTIDHAFEMYNKHRQERMKIVENETKIYGLAARVDFPVLCSLRNKLLQLTPTSYHNEKLRKVFEIEDYN